MIKSDPARTQAIDAALPRMHELVKRLVVPEGHAMAIDDVTRDPSNDATRDSLSIDPITGSGLRAELRLTLSRYPLWSGGVLGSSGADWSSQRPVFPGGQRWRLVAVTDDLDAVLDGMVAGFNEAVTLNAAREAAAQDEPEGMRP